MIFLLNRYDFLLYDKIPVKLAQYVQSKLFIFLISYATNYQIPLFTNIILANMFLKETQTTLLYHVI